MKAQLTIRDLFWLVLVCAIASAWYAHYSFIMQGHVESLEKMEVRVQEVYQEAAKASNRENHAIAKAQVAASAYQWKREDRDREWRNAIQPLDKDTKRQILDAVPGGR